MYTQLLGAAWEEFAGEPTDDGATPGDLLVRLLDLWPVVQPGAKGRGSDGVPGPSSKGVDTVANHLGYDVTLMRLAATIGIEPDPTGFIDPTAGRRRLESALGEAGIDLGMVGDLGPRSAPS